MTDIGRCIVTDCPAVPEYSVIGTFNDGESWHRLTKPSGEWVRSCAPHLPEVLHRMTTFPGAPPRTKAQPLYDSTHDDSPARPDPNRAERRARARGRGRAVPVRHRPRRWG